MKNKTAVINKTRGHRGGKPKRWLYQALTGGEEYPIQMRSRSGQQSSGYFSGAVTHSHHKIFFQKLPRQ